MRILFLGGSGLISSACSEAAIAAGHELTVLNRGATQKVPLPAGVVQLRGDVRNAESMRQAVAGHTYDVVVDWLAFVPDDVERALSVFGGAGQYVFISSASVYDKPPADWLVTEETPLSNPHWQYSRDKIACEQVLAERSDVHWTVVRPSLTYGPSQVPLVVNSWDKPYTVVDRMRRGQKVIVPGDGTALWTMTHNTDFAAGLAPLLGNERAIGEAFHITSDEALTWNQYYRAVAEAAGAEIDIVHVPTDGLIAANPEDEGSLWGDKVHSTIFDNSKLRELVPDFEAQVPFADGIRETIEWFDADDARREVDAELSAHWDRIIAVYERALADVTAR
jgi:nucleoside-diphosphate-sugar epimerase